jgi:hypothetical protein
MTKKSTLEFPLVHGRPFGLVAPARRAVIETRDGSFAERLDECWHAVEAENDPPFVFLSGDRIVFLAHDDRQRLSMRTLEAPTLRVMLARLVRWEKETKGGPVEVDPPQSLLAPFLDTPNPNLPRLDAIVSAPVFGVSGSLITASGYNPDARVFYAPPPGFTLPPVPNHPTKPEIEAAVRFIDENLFSGFPFVGPADRAHAWALLLTAFVRPFIRGSLPLIAIEKPTPGTGATLMVNCIHLIVTGTPLSSLSEGEDDAEWRKRITAALIEGRTFICFDNINLMVNSSALTQVLTAETWSDRLLGASKNVEVPNRAIWCLTANNPRYSIDMVRRTVVARLDARTEQPWNRTGFRHADLPGFVTANRAAFVHACLVIIQAWMQTGRIPGSAMLGSFEVWCRTIGGILTVAGIRGFLANKQEHFERADSEGAASRAFVEAWFAEKGTEVQTTAVLIDVALSCDPLLPLGDGGDFSKSVRLGKHIGRLENRTFTIEGTDLRIERVRISGRAQGRRLRGHGGGGPAHL